MNINATLFGQVIVVFALLMAMSKANTTITCPNNVALIFITSVPFYHLGKINLSGGDGRLTIAFT